MGHIVLRKRKDGTTGYTAQIVIKKGGAVAHREAKTFDRRQAASAWMVQRETELAKPGAIERERQMDNAPPLRDVIDKYNDTSAVHFPSGNSVRPERGRERRQRISDGAGHFHRSIWDRATSVQLRCSNNSEPKLLRRCHQ